MTEAKAKGKWLPCGCREEIKTGKLVRLCAEHQAEADAKAAAKEAKK